MIDSPGDAGAALDEGRPATLGRLYRALDLGVRYEPSERVAYVTARPRVDSACVRGDSATNSSQPCARQGFMRQTVRSERPKGHVPSSSCSCPAPIPAVNRVSLHSVTLDHVLLPAPTADDTG